jgi:hypothetical protein
VSRNATLVAAQKTGRESIATIRSTREVDGGGSSPSIGIGRAASLHDILEQECIIVYEFKLEGMTCVNCSSAIENGMKIEFKDKGLVREGEKDDQYSVSVILLMHKMKISFNKKVARQHSVDENKIISGVEDLGFGAELLNTYEL